MSLNPEQRLMRGDAERLSELEDRLYKELVPNLERESIRIEDFEGLYDPKMLARDNAEVERLEKIYATDAESGSKKRGRIFEAMLNDQIEESNWLGENARVIIPSKYDDYKNGVDSIVEFDEETNRAHLALAIDITKSPEEVRKKLARIRGSINEGTLSEIKYFLARNNQGEITERAEKSGVPRVVVGADQKTMDEVGELLIRYKTLRKNQPKPGEVGHDDFRKLREKLAAHPMQFQIISEVRAQLTAFRGYAEANNKLAVIPAFDRMLGILDSIMEQKPEAASEETLARIEEDEVYKMILEETRNFGEH